MNPTNQTDHKPECVILLHGLARTKRSMNVIQKSVEKAGYFVINIDYPSTRYPVETLAESTISQALSQAHGLQCTRLHVITHSMGGILIRYYLSQHKISSLRRISR